MKRLWRLSHAIGFVPSLCCAIAWLAGACVIVRAGAGALWQYPVLAWTFLIFLGLVVAFGTLISFWILMDHVEFRRRGYQIRWLAEDEWVYEERSAGGLVKCLPFARKTLGDGYPAPCRVYIQDEESWERQVPQWAQGRRSEITERIANLSGANSGG